MKILLTFPKEIDDKVKGILDKEMAKQQKEAEKINKSMRARMLRRVYPNFLFPSNFLSYKTLNDTQIEVEINVGIAEKLINPFVVFEPLKKTFDEEIGQGLVKLENVL